MTSSCAGAFACHCKRKREDKMRKSQLYEPKRAPSSQERARVRAECPRVPPDPPPRNRVVARAEVVSWLRVSFARLPGDLVSHQWPCERSTVWTTYPLQWRGRTGVTPVSVSPTRVEL